MTSSLGDQLGALLGQQAEQKKDADDLPEGIHGEVAAIVKKMADEVPSLGLNTPLTDYGFDRLSIVELAVHCEEEIGVLIDDDAIPGFRTLGDVVSYITARRG